MQQSVFSVTYRTAGIVIVKAERKEKGRTEGKAVNDKVAVEYY